MILTFIIAPVVIYFFTSNYRSEDFYNQLNIKTSNTTRLLVDVEEVDSDLLQMLEADQIASLPNERITLYNGNNSIAFTLDKDGSFSVTPEILAATKSEKSVQYRIGCTEILSLYFKGANSNVVVSVGAEDIYGFRKVRNLIRILFFLLAFSVFIAVIIWWIFAGKAVDPISKVVDQVDAMSVYKMDLRVVEGNGQDDISRLAQTFNKMLERLKFSCKIKKDFIINASHELRTPLTAITGQL